MDDKVTVSERFGEWFRAVLANCDGDEWDYVVRELWLDLCGSILGHEQERCACIGCNLMRRSEWNAHMAAALSLTRHDQLQRRNA